MSSHEKLIDDYLIKSGLATSNSPTLAPLPEGAKKFVHDPPLGQNFYPMFVDMARSLGMKPEDALAFMASESGMKPGALNHDGMGGGIFGAMPDTQRRLGFTGTPEQWVQLTGEQQLPYFKKHLQGLLSTIKSSVGNVRSAADLYLGNFWPAAFGLPGIKAGDPKTIFIEKNPEAGPPVKRKDGTTTIPSKKYHDVGNDQVSARFEAQAYNSNYNLFDKERKGYITYGDMQRQVSQNLKGQSYNNAIKMMQQTTGYVANAVDPLKGAVNSVVNTGKQMAETVQQAVSPTSTGTTAPTPAEEGIFDSAISGVWDWIKNKLSDFGIALGANQQQYLFKIACPDTSCGVKYASILSTALNEYLQAENTIRHENDEVEIESRIYGDKLKTYAAIREFSNALAEEFPEPVFVTIAADLDSDLPEIEIETNEMFHRKFALKHSKGISK